MIIPLSELTHTATLLRKTASTKDTYGATSYTNEQVDIPCFFDTLDTVEQVKFQDKSVVIGAVLFIRPDDNVKLNDDIISIKNNLGIEISNGDFKVVKMKPATDNEGIHHYEVFLTTSK